MMQLNKFCRFAVDFDGWFDHTLGWWQQVKDSDHILLVKYEDLIKVSN